MPTPTYISATNFLKGVAEAEAAINIESYEQAFSDEKLYVENKAGSRTGLVHNFNTESTITISGETNTSALTAVMGVAFGVAETVANLITGYGVTAGSVLLEDLSISQNRGSLATASANLVRIPDIVIA
jgi:hypothetical protein